jgi:hypothetical protein
MTTGPQSSTSAAPFTDEERAKAAAHGIDLDAIRGVKAYRVHCYYCHEFVLWTPVWDADCFDKGYSCTNCGATSIRYTEAKRPIGPRSQHWPLAVEDIKVWIEIADQDYLWRELEAGLV